MISQHSGLPLDIPHRAVAPWRPTDTRKGKREITQMITMTGEAWYFQVGQDVRLKREVRFMEVAAEAEGVVVVSPGPKSWTQWSLVSSVPGSSTYTLRALLLLLLLFS